MKDTEHTQSRRVLKENREKELAVLAAFSAATAHACRPIPRSSRCWSTACTPHP